MGSFHRALRVVCPRQRCVVLRLAEPVARRHLRYRAGALVSRAPRRRAGDNHCPRAFGVHLRSVVHLSLRLPAKFLARRGDVGGYCARGASRRATAIPEIQTARSHRACDLVLFERWSDRNHGAGKQVRDLADRNPVRFSDTLRRDFPKKTKMVSCRRCCGRRSRMAVRNRLECLHAIRRELQLWGGARFAIYEGDSDHTTDLCFSEKWKN